MFYSCLVFFTYLVCDSQKHFILLFEETPAITFKITTGNSYVKFIFVNENVAKVIIASPSSLPSDSLDLVRIECETNFDYPSEVKLVKVYITNGVSGLTDVWTHMHSDFDEATTTTTTTPSLKYEAVSANYQLYTNLNSLYRETVSLDDIIISNFNTTINTLRFECSLLDDKAQPPTLLISSNNLTVSIGKQIIFYLLTIRFLFYVSSRRKNANMYICLLQAYNLIQYVHSMRIFVKLTQTKVRALRAR